MEKVNLAEKLGLFDEQWSPRIVADVGSSQIKLVKLQGEFVWHSHEAEDEMFLVLAGRMRMDFRDRQVWLEPGELIVVPHGVEHRPYAEIEAHVMLVEPSTTLNTGNVREARTVEAPARI